jgi:hypothetical protein
LASNVHDAATAIRRGREEAHLKNLANKKLRSIWIKEKSFIILSQRQRNEVRAQHID